MQDKINKKLESQNFVIIRSYNAKRIISLGSISGLEDVTDWVTPEMLDQFLRQENNVAFIVNRKFDPAYSNESILEMDHEQIEELYEKRIIEGVGLIIVGYEEESRMWIELLGVREKFRRKGLAKCLIDVVKDLGKKSKTRAIFVDLDDDNFGALKFYKKAGFKNSGFIKEYYYDKTDAIIMRMDL